MPGSKTSIVIADAQPLFREGMKCLLNADDQFAVTGITGSGQEALRLVETTRAEILLLDLALTGYTGVDTLREWARKGLSCRIVLLTTFVDEAQSIEALRLGARGIVLKNADMSLLKKCLHAVVANQYWIGRRAVGSLVAALRKPVASKPLAHVRFALTPREIQVVRAVATGATNRQVASRLKIAEPTVKQHIVSALEKCGVANRTELALLAVRHRIVER